MSIIIPDLLKKGDTIGIVAPAVPLTAIANNNLKIGIKNIKDMGFSVRFSSNIEMSLKNPLSAMKRTQDLHDMFLDNEIRCVMALIGGYSSLEMLDYLDFELIRNNPKSFIGFSDITVLNIVLREHANLMNFYGPTFAIFCQKNLPKYTQSHFIKMLTKNEEDQIENSEFYTDDLWYKKNDGNRNWKENRGMRIIRLKEFESECIGGNLDTILALAGTRFWPVFDSKILFLEEGNNPKTEEVRRKIMQLKLMGVFDKIKGMVFGRFWGWSMEKSKQFFEYISDTILCQYDFAIIADMDFGHSDPMITIPEGGKMIFDGKSIRIKK